MNSQNDFSEKLFLLKLLRLSQVPISEADLARTVYGEDTVRSRRAVRKHLYEMHGDFFGNESNGVFGLTRQKKRARSFEWFARHIEPNADAEELIERQLAYVTLERNLQLFFPASTACKVMECLDASPLHYGDFYESLSSLDHPSQRPRLGCENTDGKLYFLPVEAKNDEKSKK